MATQSTLTITNPDPSGTHPTGDLNANWAESVDDNAIRYTANTIMDDVAAGTYHTDTTADYYSSVLCVGPFSEGIRCEIGATGNAQLTACWQWYNPATNGDDVDFSMAADGKAGTFGNGTWTDIGTPAVDYDVAALHGAFAADVAALDKGAMLRVKLVALDAGGGSGGDGITHTIINAGIAAVNAAYCTIPFDKKASNNLSMVEQYTGQTISGSIGGIGVDPS